MVVKKNLSILDEYLASHTYLVGNSVTLADIIGASNLYHGFTKVQLTHSLKSGAHQSQSRSLQEVSFIACLVTAAILAFTCSLPTVRSAELVTSASQGCKGVFIFSRHRAGELTGCMSAQLFDEAFRNDFPNVQRWFLTLANQPAFKKVMGEVVLAKETLKYTPKKDNKAAPAAKPAAPKESKPEQPKKESKPAPAKVRSHVQHMLDLRSWFLLILPCILFDSAQCWLLACHPIHSSLL